MNMAQKRTTIVFRMLILILCCALFFPHFYKPKKNFLAESSTHIGSMLYAVSSVSNISSSLSSFFEKQEHHSRIVGKKHTAIETAKYNFPLVLSLLQYDCLLCLSGFFIFHDNNVLQWLLQSKSFSWLSLAPPASLFL